MHSRTLKGMQGSKPSPRTEQPSGPRSTEFVRHSGDSSMKTPHRGRFIPCECDTQLFKQAPGRMVDTEAVQACKKGVLLRLEVVLNETPQQTEAHHRAKISWHCQQRKGVFCKICHALFAIATSPVSGGF